MTKVYFQTHGCSTNQAEEEVMAGLLNREGYSKVERKEDADLIILNMCSVKGLQVTKKQLLEIKKDIDRNNLERNITIENNIDRNEIRKEQKLIVAGCIPRKELDEIKAIAPNASYCHTDNMMEISIVANETMIGKTIEKMDVKKGIKIGVARIRRNNLVAIIPINEGCNDACTYCSTKLIKGSTLSYPLRTILKEVEDALESGCKEIQLTSQDTGAYGWDTAKRSLLPDLIKSILKIKIEDSKNNQYAETPLIDHKKDTITKSNEQNKTPDFKLRIGMLNPMNIYEQFDEVLDAMEDIRVYKFLHLPLQAGDNRVLKEMKRKYSVEQFIEMSEKFYKRFPSGTIATDIIVGFPSETDEEFVRTLDVLRKLRFDVVNISRYVDRAGTISFRMKDKVHGQDSKKRSEILTELFEKIAEENKKKWLGKEMRVLINDKKEDLVARNENYSVVVIKRTVGKNKDLTDEEYNSLLGKDVKVRIVDSSVHYLVGEVVE